MRRAEVERKLERRGRSSLQISLRYTVLLGAWKESFVKKQLIDLRSAWKGISKAPSSISEVEKRMRPGAFSARGFLGKMESLEAVIAQDDQMLKELGLSHDHIADALEEIMQCALGQRDELFKRDVAEYWKREGSEQFLLLESIHCCSIDNLPSADVGYLVQDALQVFIRRYRGFQECPWECENDGGWGCFDFLILNRQLGQVLTFPGLIVHLIRKHHFFEGLESPYRVDPFRAAQILGLVPTALAQTEQSPCTETSMTPDAARRSRSSKSASLGAVPR
jgi:hypothetical protein